MPVTFGPTLFQRYFLTIDIDDLLAKTRIWNIVNHTLIAIILLILRLPIARGKYSLRHLLN